MACFFYPKLICLQQLFKKKIFSLCAVWLAIFYVSCGSLGAEIILDASVVRQRDVPEDIQQCDPPEDPFEDLNRAIFAFNEGVDGFLLNPALVMYTFFVPPPVRRGVQNVFDNLNEPAAMVSHFLQSRNKAGRQTLARFLINSTLGLCGLFDVASRLGLKRQPNNFNTTLKHWGVSAGPYTVWPVLGPFSMRDSFGGIIDFFLDPFNTVAWFKDATVLLNTKVGMFYMIEKEKYWKELLSLKDSSIDYYAMVRSLYYQKRHCGLASEQKPSFFMADGPEPSMD
ncbi:MAG: VacJ family lipoprotein [Holosporaceae bacterium]